MLALSIRSPWWAWILAGLKPVENRSWTHSYRGPVLLHAATKWDDAEIPMLQSQAKQMHRASGTPFTGLSVMTFSEMRARLGCCVGIVDIVDCVSHHPSPWFTGPRAFVLENPREIVPFRVRGMPGFFDVDYRP